MDKAALQNKPLAVPHHLPHLDGLRAIAALYVVLHHAMLQASHPTVHPHNWIEWTERILTGGRLAVDLFIVLSGYSLMLTVIRNKGVLSGGAIAFYKKRARRILPPYFACLAISLLLISTLIGVKTGTHWDVCLPVTFRDIWTHAFLLQDLFHDTSGKINHVLWSISVEFRIYFLFPALLFFWKPLKPIPTALLCVFIGNALLAILPESQINLMSFSPNFLGLFALGMLAAEISCSEEQYCVRLRNKGFWNVLALAMITLTLWQGWRLGWSGEDLGAGLASFSLLIGLSALPVSHLRTVLSSKPIASIGTFAYSIYLMHAPFLQLFSQYVLTPFNLNAESQFIALIFIGSPCAVALCYPFYLVFERNNPEKRMTKK